MKQQTPHEVGMLKAVPLPSMEITLDSMVLKFGAVVKFDQSLPLLIMAAVKQRLGKIIKIACTTAVVRSRT